MVSLNYIITHNGDGLIDNKLNQGGGDGAETAQAQGFLKLRIRGQGAGVTKFLELEPKNLFISIKKSPIRQGLLLQVFGAPQPEPKRHWSRSFEKVTVPASLN